MERTGSHLDETGLFCKSWRSVLVGVVSFRVLPLSTVVFQKILIELTFARKLQDCIVEMCLTSESVS